MTRHLIRRLKSPAWQVAISGAFTGLIALIIFSTPVRSGISGVDRATFVSALGALATLLALFCSLSLSWILFLYQQIKSQRVAAYDMLKQCVIDTESWLQTSEQACYRELCLSLLWEIDKIRLTDTPCFDSFPEYEEYCTALALAIDSEDRQARQFFQRSSFYFARIEELMSRFGITAIQLIRLKWFIDALAKGFLIVSASVFVLLCTLIWFTEYAKPFYIIAATFLSAGTVLVLLEVWVDLIREYEEELTFIQRTTKG
jgi:hypothetical protein